MQVGVFDLQRRAADAGVLDRFADQVKHPLDARVKRLALLSQAQATRLSMKQRIPQMFLKPGDLPAHRALVMCSCSPARVKLQHWAVIRKVCKAGSGGRRFMLSSAMNSGHG